MIVGDEKSLLELAEETNASNRDCSAASRSSCAVNSAGIAKTITTGVPQPKDYRSPMPPMGGAQLTPDQVSAVAAYVWSLGGGR
jgi:hypothetical protein